MCVLCCPRPWPFAPQAKYLAASTGKDEETIMQDFSRPKYFSPFEAADYGLIDQVGVVVGQLWEACESFVCA